MRGDAAAAGGTHVHHEGLRGAGATHLGQPARQRRRGIHLAHARIEEMRAGGFEQPARIPAAMP